MRGVALFAPTVLVVLVLSGAARAANIVPNPGFESDCGGTPCGWSAFASALLATDGSTSHGGSSSLRVSADGSITGAQSSCIGITPGTYGSSIWFRTTDPKVLAVHVAAETFTAGQCDDIFHFGSFPYGASKTLTAADRDGAWHFVSGPINISTGDVARVLLLVECDPCSAGDRAAVSFDDVAVGDTPTAVTVTSFSARRAGPDVVVRWRTRAEAGLLGFRVYRGRRLLTRRVLPALGAPGGRSYTYRDRGAIRGVYRLELVFLDGRSKSAGRFTIR